MRSVACIFAVAWALPLPSVVARPNDCPPQDDIFRDGVKEGGCVETCELKGGTDERPSDSFLEKLRTIAPTGHHVDTVFGEQLQQRLGQFRVVPFDLSSKDIAFWRQNRRWAGPCTGLVAYFYSTVVENKDSKNVVDLHELRYQTEEEARRVAALLATSWDWNYHPFVAVHAGRSVIVAEGRHRAWDALARVAAHFGGKFHQKQRPPSVPVWCDDDAAAPLFETKTSQANGKLSLHVLGFSPTGNFAWIESRARRAGSTWSLHIQDLVNDHELARRSYQGGTVDPAVFCKRYAAEVSAMLAEHGIRNGHFTGFDKPTPNTDPTDLVLRRVADVHVEVVMLGEKGSAVIGRVRAAKERAELLGFLRSPFEARVATMVLTRGPKEGELALQVFGGRLDKGWKK